MKDLIIVILCASRKQEYAGHLRTSDGQDVMFVANPHAHGAPPNGARPDDVSDTGEPWRDVLEEYNEEYKASGDNPLRLLPAWQLYKDPIYKSYEILVRHYGKERVYILSAGWGLIRADFLTPDYDITFSTASNVKLYQRRHRQDKYDDFKLPSDVAESAVFFGSRNYIDFFCRMTSRVRVQRQRMIFWAGNNKPDASGCMLREYKTTLRTNWHYKCAKEFAEGRLPGFDQILADLGCDS